MKSKNLSDALLNVQQIKSISADKNQAIQGVFLIKKVAVRTARNGSPFLSVEVADNTGSFSFNCFHGTLLFELLEKAQEGDVFYLEGNSDYYQDKLSPRISHVSKLSQEEIESQSWLSKLIASSLEDPESLWQELLQFIAKIEHPVLRSTVEYALNEVSPIFRESTAAVSMHHAYRHGLLEHTVHVARAIFVLLPLYPEVNGDIALAGALLHDIGKAIEYDTGLTVKKTRVGVLQGHVVLGYRIVRKAAIQAKLEANLIEQLEHIILSHQGELEWGAAVMAATPEAVFVSMVDNLDAKMGMVQQALRETPDLEAFSAYLPGLKSPILRTSPHHS